MEVRLLWKVTSLLLNGMHCAGSFESFLTLSNVNHVLFYAHLLQIPAAVSQCRNFVFAKLYKDISRIKSQIEREGRGDVSKTKRQINPNPWHGNIRCTEIPQDTLQAIFELLSDVQALMKSRLEQNQIQYETDLCKIPENYR